ncbi:hypothetical protein FA15DRAFT_692491 [Coprinopsis marcescibilis]|uniref:Uncharacterized protein n=1 Tax=Coprinopsis marcescibilis TaxID=230819 RepID=A0A5C3L3E8_COPMA|nr:hypothetical protein FA15DRAFT_692491 [Coprinopsis marcescibilis]
MSSTKHWNIPFPEIDARLFTVTTAGISMPAITPYGYPPIETSVDVWDVYPPTPELSAGACNIAFKTALNHQNLVEHLEANTKFSRFLNSMADFSEGKFPTKDPDTVALETSTAEYFIKTLGVSPVFVASITTDPWFLKNGNGCFHKRDKQGNHCVDGFYRFSSGFNTTQFISNVWSSHKEVDINMRTSTYIIRNCPLSIKNSITCAAFSRDNLATSLLRPMAVDVFISEGASHGYGRELIALRTKLIEHEQNLRQNTVDICDNIHGAIKKLHVLSQNLHLIIIPLTKLYMPPTSLRMEANLTSLMEPVPMDQHRLDSISYLHSKVRIWKRWTQNYIDRTSILINMLFNFASQWDNQANIRVADYTSKIATVSQRDSSSMIAMTTVAMVFLPGAFRFYSHVPSRGPTAMAGRFADGAITSNCANPKSVMTEVDQDFKLTQLSYESLKTSCNSACHVRILECDLIRYAVQAVGGGVTFSMTIGLKLEALSYGCMVLVLVEFLSLLLPGGTIYYIGSQSLKLGINVVVGYLGMNGYNMIQLNCDIT